MSEHTEELECLRFLETLSGGVTPPGFGEPSPVTQRLHAQQLIEIQMKISGGRVYWRAKITDAGRARVREGTPK